MIQSLYTAASTISAQQTNINIIANNIANISTDGFKKSRVDFRDALYATLSAVPGNTALSPDTVRRGHGVLVDSVKTDFSDGSLIQSEDPADIVIGGEAFFKVQTRDGRYMYTKSGTLCTFDEDGRNYLASSQGYYFLDRNGNRILANSGEAAKTDTSVLNAVTFPNPEGLGNAGDGMFYATDASGEAVPADGYKVRRGFTESSNVDMAKEMTSLIRAQRTYSLASRALTAADNMEALANQIVSRS